MFLHCMFRECTGIKFVDSTCIPVHSQQAQFNMKVFKDIAAKVRVRCAMVCRLSSCICYVTKKES